MIYFWNLSWFLMTDITLDIWPQLLLIWFRFHQHFLFWYFELSTSADSHTNPLTLLNLINIKRCHCLIVSKSVQKCDCLAIWNSINFLLFLSSVFALNNCIILSNFIILYLFSFYFQVTVSCIFKPAVHNYFHFCW